MLGTFAGAIGAPNGVQIDPARTVFAVITHKGGVASGLAENHIVAAGKSTVDLRFNETTPLETSMELTASLADLSINDPQLTEVWYPRLQQLGILERPVKELSEKNLAKVRRLMLGDRQLAAEDYPTLVARISEVRLADGHADNDFGFPYVVDLSLTLRDVTVTKPVRARYVNRDGDIEIEAYGAFRFTDFGIKPYSAMLGTVRNRDMFHIFTSLGIVDPD